ncbi:MAG: ectonucleotide pyrophosphatase/phosphodiesterase [Chitinophagaceae bacterium]
MYCTMLKRATKSCIAVFSGLILLFNSQAQQAKYVVLVTIDGFRPDFYLDESWGMPNLRHMMEEGVYAKAVRGVFPTYTYPSHTTIMTGVMPAKHGVYYNAPFEPQGATGNWYWDSKYIQVPTLWQAARKAGLTTANVLWPVTVGADIDYNVPEIWSTAKDQDRVVPMRQHTTPVGLFEEIEQNATGKLLHDDLNGELLTFDENLARMGAYLIKTYKPRFTAIHFPCVDEAEHNEGRDGHEVRLAVASADRCIGKLLEAIKLAGIKDSTAIIVTGDHGFSDIHTAILPNVWLAQNNLLVREANNVTWKAMFQPANGSAFLYLKDSGDIKTLQQVRSILDKLPVAYKKLFQVLERKELDALGVDRRVALALAPIDGVVMGGAASGDVMRAVGQKGTHGYLPDNKNMYTGFVAMGAGFNKGVYLPIMGLEDIAPLVTQLLGITPLPDGVGVVYPGMLKKK